MEEIKVLVFALVSFFSQENLPIAARFAEVHIDRVQKRVIVQQNDIYSLEAYRDQAIAGLDSLIHVKKLNEELAPLRLVELNFYEEDQKLHATISISYDDLKDLRLISFYNDGHGVLSYPNMKEYEYDLQTGSMAQQYIRFDADEDVRFIMQRKKYRFEGIYSLLEDWRVLKKGKK